MPPTPQKIAVVSGASRGIGAATAIQLGRRGCHVFLLARNLGGLEQTDDAIRAAGGTTTIVPFDFKKPELLDQLGLQIHNRFGRLDYFVAAAGYLGELSPVSHTSTAMWNEVLNTNLNANYHLIRTLDPLLRQTPASHAVFVTDDNAIQKNEGYWGAYTTAKAGLSAMAQVYANENQQSSVSVHLYSPPASNTALRQKAYPGQDYSQWADPASAADEIVTLMGMN